MKIKKRFLFLIFCLILLIVGVVLFNTFKYIFRVKKIFIISEFPIEYGLEKIAEENIFFLNEQKLATYLLDRNPEIKQLEIIKNYPDNLTLKSIWRTPFAQLRTPKGTNYIDEEGVILLRYQKQMNLPEIDTNGLVFQNTAVKDWRLVKSVLYLKSFSLPAITISRVSIDHQTSTFHLYLSDGTEVIVLQSSDPLVISASLQIIVARFRIEGKFIRKIDFQFDKPIVTLENQDIITAR